MAAILYPVTLLDSTQVIQHAYDESTQSLRTTATATIIGGDLTVDTSHTEDSMRLGDGTNFLTSTSFGGKVSLDVALGKPISQTTDSIRIGDGSTLVSVTTVAGKYGLDVNIINDPLVVNTNSNASTPTIYNVSAPLAGTEYSQVLPTGLKKIGAKLRAGATAANLQFAYTLGGSSSNYVKVPFGSFYTDDGLNTSTSLTFYFQTDQAGQTLELIVWT
jgi:hypothetical protein